MEGSKKVIFTGKKIQLMSLNIGTILLTRIVTEMLEYLEKTNDKQE